MLLIGNGIVFTRDENNTSFENGAVVTEGNLIKEVGEFEAMRAKYPDAEFVDAKGGVILPGFINAHQHIYSAFARGLALKNYAPTNFIEVLEQNWWHVDNTLTVEDVSKQAALVFLESLRNGVTTVYDHHASYGETTGSLHAIAEQAKRFGVRACLCYEISDRNGREKMEEATAENYAFVEEAKKSPDELAGLIGLHASFTLSDESLQYITERNKDNVGYHVHVAEGIYDEEDAEAKYGMRVLERLHKWGILGEQTVTGHCVHINDHERQLLVETNSAVVHNPESNMGNAIGAPDVLALAREGVVCGLGTDGFTSDMLESLKFANLLVKHREQDSNVGFLEAMDMLFTNNAKLVARHFPHPVGALVPGYYADVIVMDYTAPTPLTADNINGHLCFAMNGAMVKTTVSQGVVRYLDRELVGIDEKALREEIRKQAADFWERVNA